MKKLHILIILLVFLIGITVVVGKSAKPATGTAVIQYASINNYCVRDLGLPDGYNDMSEARAVNDSGQVVGRASADDVVEHAFIWDKNNGFKILLPPGWVRTSALDINNLGQVIGTASTGTVHHAFLWEETNGYIYFGVPAGYTTSGVSAINDEGQVTGTVSKGSRNSERAFIWDRQNGFNVIGVPEGFISSVGLGINNKGQVVIEAYMVKAEDDYTQAFIWDKESGFTSIGKPSWWNQDYKDYSDVYARAINDTGQVVGWGNNSGVNNNVFLWDKDNGFTDLGIPPGSITFETASAINNNGQVAGNGYDGWWTKATLWTPDEGFINLNFPPNSYATCALDINDLGVVVGHGRMGAHTSAFLAKQTIPSDINRDCYVDIFDLTMVASAFNSVTGDENYDTVADLNKDGIIDIFDLSLIGTYFEK